MTLSRNLSKMAQGVAANGSISATYVAGSTGGGSISTANSSVGQVLVSAGSNLDSYWANTIPITAYSGQFNGSNYLLGPSNAAFTFGTGDFTVEAWVYITTAGRGNSIFTNGTATNGSLGIYIKSTNIVEVGCYGGTNLNSVTALSAQTWYHIAVVRSSSTMKIFINGVLDASATNAFNNTSSLSGVGLPWTNDTTSIMVGHISNLRVIKGLAVYSGNFTVPTSPLGTSQAAGTNISAVTPSQVSLLTCTGPGIIDSSPNAFALTNTSGVVTSPFAPFSSFTAISRSAIQTQTVLTSGSGTYYTPSGVASLRVRMVGAGGGGSGSSAGTWSGSGGGSGAYLEGFIVSPASSYAYSIGAGGAGGAASANGSAGGSTTFGSLTCGGGLAGLFGLNNSNTAPTATGGIVNVSGVRGPAPNYNTVQALSGISGAPSQFSPGGAGSIAGTTSIAGSAGGYGAGGGGGGQSTNGSAGGAGGSGIIIVEENYAISSSNAPFYEAAYLVVAGGAGTGNLSGGGGAGGLLTNSILLTIGTTYTITVGAGGAGTSNQTSTSAGSNSSMSGGSTAITAIGGGAPGIYAGSGNAGGSGGGGGGSTGAGSSTGGAGTSGQGNAGGAGGFSNSYAPSGGGGGAGAAGSNAAGNNGGAGGSGVASTITGTSATYAGGGGGSGFAGGAGGSGGGGAGGSQAVGVAGTVNTGGGAGSGWNAAGAAGGSGIVIIAVPYANYSGRTTGSPTVTTVTSFSGTYKVLTFTSSGSYTA